MATAIFVLEVVIAAGLAGLAWRLRAAEKAFSGYVNAWATILLTDGDKTRATLGEIRNILAEASKIRAQKHENTVSERTKGDTVAPKRAFQSIAQRRAAAGYAADVQEAAKAERIAADVRAIQG